MLVAAAASLAGCGAPSEPRPHLLFVVVDTLRKDALHVYGHPEPVSPRLDALAARGLVFDSHVASASQTVPSTLTMHLSQRPARHGFRFTEPRSFADVPPVFPDGHLFLAEVLRDAGYATAGFSANPYLTRRNRFDQGFETFGYTTQRGQALTLAATSWLERWGTGGRKQLFFLYLHYMDVHQPYDPPEPWRRRFVRAAPATALAGNREAPEATEADRRYSLALYAAATAYVDDQIGRLLDAVEALGVGEDTVVVVTSDHGEEFLEHGGVGHGRTLFGEVVRVPMILVAPGRLPAGERVDHLSRHLDLAPTLLGLLGIPAPPSFDGKSMLEPARRALLDTATWQGVYHADWNLLRSAILDEELLFAIDDEHDREPVERPDVVPELAPHLAEYAELLRAPRPAAPATGEQPAWSADERERLRALGYAD